MPNPTNSLHTSHLCPLVCTATGPTGDAIQPMSAHQAYLEPPAQMKCAICWDDDIPVARYCVYCAELQLCAHCRRRIEEPAKCPTCRRPGLSKTPAEELLILRSQPSCHGPEGSAFEPAQSKLSKAKLDTEMPDSPPPTRRHTRSTVPDDVATCVTASFEATLSGRIVNRKRPRPQISPSPPPPRTRSVAQPVESAITPPVPYPMREFQDFNPASLYRERFRVVEILKLDKQASIARRRAAMKEVSALNKAYSMSREERVRFMNLYGDDGDVCGDD